MQAAHRAGGPRQVHAVLEELLRVVDADDGNDLDDHLHPDTVALYDQLTRRTRA